MDKDIELFISSLLGPGPIYDLPEGKKVTMEQATKGIMQYARAGYKVGDPIIHNLY